MTLHKPSDHFSGAVSTYNPLWKHIFNTYQKHMLAAVGDPGYDPQVYVERRASDAGLSVRDLMSYVANPDRQPFIIKGPAGLGKTTFLHSEFALRITEHPSTALIWVDGLTDAAEHSGSGIVPGIERK